jgi:hypothetical protein
MSSTCARSQASATCARRGTRLGRNGLDTVDDAEVAREVLASEARVGLAPVVVGKLLARANLAVRTPWPSGE